MLVVFMSGCLGFMLFLSIVMFSFVSISQVIAREGWVFCTAEDIVTEITCNVLSWTLTMLNSTWPALE